MPKDVFATMQYLEAFFRNLILGEQNELKNRLLHIEAPKHLVQSASLEVPKSHNDTLDCTLEEVALIKFVKVCQGETTSNTKGNCCAYR